MAIPEIFEDLLLKLILILPKLYLQVDLVADCYFENFIKAAERAKRNSTTKAIIKSLKIKRSNRFLKVFVKLRKPDLLH